MRPTRAVFVGRHKERRIFEQAFEEARAGRGSAVLIEGLAGTGKSRMVEHALDAASRHGFLALFGLAAEGQEGTPYGLLLDAFRRHARSQSGESQAWLDPRSAWTELMSFRPTSTLQGPQHAFHEISQALTRYRGPVLLALEDVHWADHASLEIVEGLVRELGGRPVVLLATCRREALMRDSDRAERIQRLLRHPRVRHLSLEGLSLTDTRELVEAMLPASGDHGFLARQLHRRTEGIPLFLEELLRGIGGEGAGPDAALPVSFREAVRSRLAGLAREDLRLLQFASVIGEWFDIATLAHLSRRSAGAVVEILTRLRDQQLIRDSPDRRGFKFWHALTRDALYEQLLLPDRRALHRRVAQHGMAAPAAEAQPSAIAYHLEKAGEEREAGPFYATAAERAAALCAFEEAFAHSERAFAFSADNRGERALQASRFARLAGHVGAALEYCHKAQMLLSDARDPLRQAEVWLHESDLHWLKGDGARAAELLQAVTKLRAQVSAAADAPVWAWLYARTAHRACLESRWADAFDPCDAAITMSRRLKLPAVEAHALISRSLADAAAKGFARGLATLQRGRALAEQHGLVEDVCRSYVIELDLRSREGDFAAACRTALEGAERARRAGAPVVLYPTLAASAVEFLWKTGRWQEALDRIPETERLVNEQPSDLVRCHFRCILASIALASGRLRDAEELLADARRAAGTIGEAQWLLPLHVATIQHALAARKPEEARRGAAEAIRRFPDCGALELAELHALRLEAVHALRSSGRRTKSEMAVAPRAKLSPISGCAEKFHARLAGGFVAMLAEKFAEAAREFGAAVGLAVTSACPTAEARAREWLAAALQQQREPAAKQEAVRERGRARALLATIPGRRDDGGSALVMLSHREREVARLVAEGLANKEVGARLAISERTVAVHLSRIFEKLGVDSRHRLTALITNANPSGTA